MHNINAVGWLESKLRRNIFIYLIIALAGIAAYANSISAPFTLDDFGSISNNYAIQKLFDFPALWEFYANRVVLYFTLSINYFIHDNGVEGYHIVNTAIHIFNGIILFKILELILGLPYFSKSIIAKYRRSVCLVAAVLFICHPLQVNAVTYIIQRTASLAATFYFLSVLYFLKFRIFEKKRHFVLVMLFTVLAMFTKENTVTIPFMLLIIEIMFFIKDGKTTWKKRLFVFFVLFLTLPIIPGTNLLLKGHSISDPDVSFKASTSMDRMQYFYTELNVMVHYIKLMFIPDHQNFDYSNDYPLSITIWDNYSYVSLVLLLLAGLFAVYTYKRNRLVSLGIIWFFVGLAVESTFISIKDVYFEHRLYFPCAGFVMFLMGMLFYKRKRKREDTTRYFIKKPFLMFMVLSVVLFLAYTGLTVRRNYIYSDSIRLWTDVVEKAPLSDRAHCVLATSYLNAYNEKLDNKESLHMAVDEFKKSLELNSQNSTAHCNLSKVYYFLGNYDLCIDEAKETLKLTKSTYAYHNMALAYKKLNMISDAKDALLKGYQVDNKCTFILRTLADIYYEGKDYSDAKTYYEKYLEYSRNTDNKTARERIMEIDKITSQK
jgi:tetratricopeptide (TPR) repeat protein